MRLVINNNMIYLIRVGVANQKPVAPILINKFIFH